METRNLSANGVAYTSYPFNHESGTSSLTIHACTTIDDPGGLGEKYWTFSSSGANIGLVLNYQGRAPTGGNCTTTPGTGMIENDFTWTQDSTGNNYIEAVVTTADPGQSYAIAKETTQVLDIHGNVLQVNKYNYSGYSPAMLTYTYAYLTSSSYTNLYIFNRLTSATETSGSTNITLESIGYDQTSLATQTGALEWDGAYGGIAARGNATTMTDVSGNITTISYDIYGDTVGTTVDGVSSTASMTTTTNFAAPSLVSVGSSLNTTVGYSPFLGVTSQVGPNGTAASIVYDTSDARPASSTSPFGATTNYAYNDTASPPNVCASVNSRWTETILDGLGRTLKVLTGSYGYSGETGCSTASGATTLSETDTTYGSAAVLPLGKMVSKTVPYTGSVGATSTYYYDGIGRTLAVVKGGSDTTGTTNYSYAANTEQATDPAGSWKNFTTDAFGNITQVLEPNPAGGSNYVTTYTYDLLNHLAGVSMTRSTGTQTRTFVYSGNQLTSATNPENGTVNYAYYGSGSNGFGKVSQRTDAKGQVTAYTYDSLARLSEVQRYPSGISGGEDTCQRENYYYDGNEASPPDGYAVYPSYPQNALGRLSAVEYQGGHNPGASPTCDTTFIELYTYGVPGAPTGKLLQVDRIFDLTGSGNASFGVNFTATFAYDNEGRMTSVQYPAMLDEHGVASTGPSLGYTYDSMGRLYTMTDQVAGDTLISSASYGPANELTNLLGTSYSGYYSEYRTYNSLKQLTQLTSGGLNIQYNFPSADNNGKIGSQYDVNSGERVTYTYDALNRLISAANQTTFTPEWGQSFTYDGFGNLTNVGVTQGTAPTLAVTYNSNNQAAGGPTYDANGNPQSIYLPADSGSYASTYDVENRLVSTGGSTIFYSYAPGNNRVWRGTGPFLTHSSAGSGSCNTAQWTTDEVTFWGVNGQKLGTFQLTESPTGYLGDQCDFSATATGSNYYFGGKLLKNPSGWVYPDRLGSIGKFYPYGQERPSATTNGTEKFTGYFRDSETGNDYAVNRYESPGFGMFITPDPASHPKIADPGSWNMYAYTRGDPINRVDRAGTDDDDPDCVGDMCQLIDDGYGGDGDDGFENACIASLLEADGLENPTAAANTCGALDDSDPTPSTPSPNDPVTNSPSTNDPGATGTTTAPVTGSGFEAPAQTLPLPVPMPIPIPIPSPCAVPGLCMVLGPVLIGGAIGWYMAAPWFEGSFPTVQEIQGQCRLVAVTTEPSTKRGNRSGGVSINYVYLCPDGLLWTIHVVIDENGGTVNPPHVRKPGSGTLGGPHPLPQSKD